MKSHYVSRYMVAILILGSISCRSMTISGEHINGAPYKKYSGSTNVEKAVLDELYASLLTHSTSASDKILKNILYSVEKSKWENLGPEYITMNREAGMVDKVRVGVKLRKDSLYVTFYENLVVAAFDDENGTHFYYLRNQKPYKVTDRYIFPLAIDSLDDTGFLIEEDS